MQKTFISLLTEFVEDNGGKILENPDRFKSLFLDFTQNQYKAEIQIFCQFLASPQAQEIKQSDDVDELFLKGVADRFNKTYLIEKNICEQITFAYAQFLGLVGKKGFEAGLKGETAKAKEKKVKQPAEDKHALKFSKKNKKIILIAVAIIAVISLSIFGINKSIETQQQRVAAGLVFIQGGTFMMGSPVNESGHNSYEIQRQVTISSFNMGRFPVTQREYHEVMGVNLSYFIGDDLPVETVTWFDAIEYCIRRSQREGLTPAYTMTDRVPATGNPITSATVTWNRNANGYRLPTEAEWEYACRAGTTTAYNTGVNINDSRGWFQGNSNNRTHPVGQRRANAWGLFDMHGNVLEWCWDLFGDYNFLNTTDPIGASAGANRRTLRGGSWNNVKYQARSAARFDWIPNDGRYDIGFRVARNAE
ncbi:MAG: formylglycine-generating enzyme family protein [Treponema sp.]|nr:formylglycine-generating enzyme family protein [Treponema sp.]